MANDAETYEKEIIEIIKKHCLFNVLSIFAFYKGCCRATFYNLELDKLDSVKNAIEDNKIVTGHTLKNKWLKSDNPTLQLALFKTICTDEERKHLSMSYNTLAGDKENPLIPPHQQLTPEERRAEIAALKAELNDEQ